VSEPGPTDPVIQQPPLWLRLLIAAAVAVVAALLADHPMSEDFSPVWSAARMMLGGTDPYAAIGPGRAFDTAFPLYYPATAAVAVLPLSVLPLDIARIVFAAGGAAVFSLMLTRDGLSKLPWLASYTFLSCLYVVQWTTWLAAAAAYPVIGFVASAKPNAGVAVLAAIRSRRGLILAVGGCTIVALISLALDPDWPLRWFAATRGVPHIRVLALVHPAGVLLLAGLLRWRRPEAAALVTLAVIPHNPLPHNFLLLAVGRWTAIESTILAALSWCAVAFIWPRGQQHADFTALSTVSGRVSLFLLYLPALVMILRKPNTA